jgi:ABC-type antimicrobial peptide transport system permease subunit
VTWWTIVGVAPTIRQGIAAAPRPVVYVPLASHSAVSAAIIVGGLAQPAAATPGIRKAVAMLDPEVVVSNVRPLPELLSDSRLQHRLLGTVLAVFAGVALLLSTVGVYALAAYAVRQRRHEIGVRMALGATSSQVVWLFARRALTPVALGTVIGLGGAVLIGRLLQGLLVDISATDPVTLVAVVTLLMVVTVAASTFPSRHAARRTPMAVLKCE